MNTFDLTAYLLDELSPEERAVIDRALADSPELRAELESIRETHAAIAAHLAAETGPEPVAKNVVDFRMQRPVTPFRKILVFLGTPAGFGSLAACATLATALILFAPEKGAERTIRAEATESTTTAPAVAEPDKFTIPKQKSGNALPGGNKPVIRTTTDTDSRVLPAAAPSPATPSFATGLSVRAKVDFESDYIFRGKEHSDENVQTKIVPKFGVTSTPSFTGDAVAGSLAPRSDNFTGDSIGGFIGGATNGGEAYTRNSGRELTVDSVSAASGRRAAAPAATVIAGKYPSEQPAYTRRISGAGDKFDAGVTEQAYIRTADSPLSTFSVDVNTASYAYARRMLAESGLPPAESVRIEEWLNNFAYAYPAPTGGHPVSVYAEGSECPWNAEHRIVRVGLRAASVSQENRPPANLVFLIDTSGSMMPQDRLPLAKEALLKLLDNLDERDRVGIVTYAGNSGVAAEPTVCDREGKKKLEAVILSLGSGGSTNGAAGLREAYDLASRHLNAKGVNRVVLATDGDFNVGLSGTAEIVDLAKREAGKKVFLTVLGFGTGNLNADLMKQLSVKADGNHYYIDSLKEADRVLSKKLAGTLVTVARDVKIQIDFNPARVASYRLIGYDTRRLANEDFNDDTKDAGEMGSGHTVTALYEIIPVGATPPVDASRYVAVKPVAEKPAAPASEEWLTVKVRYQPPEGGKSTLIERPLPAAGMRALAESSPDQRFAAAVAEAALVFRNSAHKGSADIDDAIRWLASPGVTGDDADRKEFADMLRMARHLGK